MIPTTPVHLHTIRIRLKMQVLHEKKRRKIWAWKRQQPLRIESSCTGMPEWGDWGGYIFTTNRCDIEENWMNATNFHFTHAVTVPSGAVVCSITIASSISGPLDFQDILCLKWFAKSTNTVSSGRETTRNKPAPSLATSSSSVDVLAEVMASGSFRVKGNTSLVGKTLIEVKEQRGGGGDRWELNKLN